MAYIRPDGNKLNAVMYHYTAPSGNVINAKLNYETANYLDITPQLSTKKYGTSQTLSCTIHDVTVPCDCTFYLKDGTQIGTTISGVLPQGSFSTTLQTPSAVTYSWFVITTYSGIIVRSPDYDFYVRYMCSGICNVNGTPIADVSVRAYRRTNGQLVGGTTTSGSGEFLIDSIYNEKHYAVALYTDENTNALIYDHLAP